jgi:hypothetical protein
LFSDAGMIDWIRRARALRTFDRLFIRWKRIRRLRARALGAHVALPGVDQSANAGRDGDVPHLANANGSGRNRSRPDVAPLGGGTGAT